MLLQDASAREEEAWKESGFPDKEHYTEPTKEAKEYLKKKLAAEKKIREAADELRRLAQEEDEETKASAKEWLDQQVCLCGALSKPLLPLGLTVCSMCRLRWTPKARKWKYGSH